MIHAFSYWELKKFIVIALGIKRYIEMNNTFKCSPAIVGTNL